MNLDDRISQAGAAEELSCAIKKMSAGGLTLRQILGEVRRVAVAVASDNEGYAKAKNRLGISRNTFYRIRHGVNKY